MAHPRRSGAGRRRRAVRVSGGLRHPWPTFREDPRPLLGPWSHRARLTWHVHPFSASPHVGHPGGISKDSDIDAGITRERDDVRVASALELSDRGPWGPVLGCRSAPPSRRGAARTVADLRIPGDVRHVGALVRSHVTGRSGTMTLLDETRLDLPSAQPRVSPRRWWSRGRVLGVLATLACGVSLVVIVTGSGPIPPRPSNLTWVYNQPVGGFREPPGWGIRWGAPTGQTYPGSDRCALDVAGTPELISVPCEAGYWHWAGVRSPGFVPSPVPGSGTGPFPKTYFVVVADGSASSFPVP